MNWISWPKPSLEKNSMGARPAEVKRFIERIGLPADLRRKIMSNNPKRFNGI